MVKIAQCPGQKLMARVTHAANLNLCLRDTVSQLFNLRISAGTDKFTG
jgi:hypothetical protein